MRRGIYLVANLHSQDMCENLVYSIRESGCALPIRLIHFGGKAVTSSFLKDNVEELCYDMFSEAGKKFIMNLRTVLTDCPKGFLYRFLALFGDWDEFIYSDNDIVALSNWDEMFQFLDGNDLVHADQEYLTKGIYNYNQPNLVERFFGKTALESAITAGHICVKRSTKMIEDINSAVNWFKANPNIPKKHDQSLLHIASLLGKWNTLNLCKPPYNWLSSWAGDYKNCLEIIQKIQRGPCKISHLHYSGSTPKGNLAIQDLLLSRENDRDRLTKLFLVNLKSSFGLYELNDIYKKIKRKWAI